MVLATAVKAQAQCLVTRDKDLLSIGTHKGIEIVSPEDFITSLRHRRESSQ
jgi:predicted nucleic acid-binding protein